MRNKLFGRALALSLSAIIAASGILAVSQNTIAQDSKDSVIPLVPYTLSANGGVTAQITKSDELFTDKYTNVAQFSSDKLTNGIIADLDSLKNNVSGKNLVATPLTQGTVVGNSATVSIRDLVTNSLTSEIGMEISSVSGEYEHTGNLAASQSYGYIKYGRRNNLSGADGIMFYLKIDGPNLVNIEIDPRNPENPSRWTNGWDPWLMLKLGSSYSYKTLNGTAWKTASAVAREGSEIFGAMQFDSAFEGYVKIPFSSLVNDCGFVLDAKQDSFENIYIRTKSIGGKHGKAVAGPFFTVNDSTSAKITVNNTVFPEAPITIGGTISGFEEELKDVKSVLLYVKTDSANRISLTAQVKDEYIENMPELQLTAGKKAYILERGGNAWSTAEIVSTATVPAVELKGAFEGYIKIPLASFEESDSDIAVLTDVNKVTGLSIGFAGIGGKYSKALATAFLMTEDTNATDFVISSEYTEPVPEKVVVTPIRTATVLMPNWETVNHTVTNPLDFTSAVGTYMQTVNASGYEAPNMNASQAFAVFSVNQATSGNEGLVVYVKAKAGNCFMPFIEMNSPADKSRWNYDWNPFMMFAVGETYEYLPIGENTWKQGITTAGVQGNSYFGTVSFTEDFEGYIKIPFTSLVNDSGFKLSVKEDSIKNIYYRLKGIGGAYGTATIGPNFFMEKNGTHGIELNISPVQVLPLAGGIKIENNWETANVTYVDTVSALTTEQGVKATINTNYLSKYQFTGTNLAASQAYVALRYDQKNSLENSTSLMFYLKTDAAGKIMLDAWVINPEDTSRWNMGYQAIMMLKPGASYSYMSKDGNKWVNAAAVQGHSGTSATHGAMSFSGAFEGYVKIPYSSLINDSGFVFNPQLDAFDKLYIRAEGLGQEYGELVSGPFFKVVNDSESSTIEIYTEKVPVVIPDDSDEEIITRIENIFKYSGSGDRQGYYFMVGDDIREDLGFPVFRTLCSIFKNQYNIICDLQAKEGLTAEYWATNTGDNTADALISKLQGDGEGAIVDVSLMLSDTSKTAEEIVGYLTQGIQKIRAAKPKTIFVYTAPTPTVNGDTNALIEKVTKELSKLDNILVIDAYTNVFAEYYTQFYKNATLPNKQGYIQIAKYIASEYLSADYETVVTTDSSQIKLPAGATLIDAQYEVKNYVNTRHTVPVMKVGDRFINGLGITGTAVSTGIAPFSSSNQTRFELSSAVTNSSYVAFRINLPAANKIGVSANKVSDNTEIIFMAGQKYQILPDGETKWRERTTSVGRADGLKTYGAIEFDDAFTGWIRLPLRGFYNTPTMEDKINTFRFMFSELGGNYGTINIGPFVSMVEPAYVADTVWTKSDLPEMVPFTQITNINKYWEVGTETVLSPIPSLSKHKGVYFSANPAVDKQGADYMTSWFWAEMQYKNVPIGDYTHLMFYIKVPDTKENHLSLCMFTDTDFEYKVMAKMPYALLSVDSTEWQHYNAEDVGLHNYGGIILPAGFEGFIKLPISSMLPATVDDSTKLARVRYSFSYFGSDSESVLVGPAFGVTKDNDPGPAEVVYNSLPEPTTVKKLYTIEQGDIWPDRVMVYWQPLDIAKSYIMEAYTVTKTDDGYEYRLVSEKRTFTNSGTIEGLEMGTQYAILVKACDENGNSVAIYEFSRVKTIKENPYAFPMISDEMVYDTVESTPGAVTSTNETNVIPIIIIAAAGTMLGLGVIILIVILIKRRKRNNAQ